MKIPDELAIKPQDFPSAGHDLTSIEAKGLDPNSSVSPDADEILALRKTLIGAANQAWRMGLALLDSDTQEPKAELTSQDLRRLNQAHETLREALTGLELRIFDRCGEDFHPGLPEQVVTEEAQEGISRDRIIRTIRPTIMWHQTMVQRGEIDIAFPAKS
jgi:hypothetical protein